jgi:uncharacterized membrane protein
MSADGLQETPPEGTAKPEEVSTDRLITLSDGVVAIALTLLILDISVPATKNLQLNPTSVSALASGLAGTYDSWISYVVSFYVIAQFWIVHHKAFRGIRAHQGGLAAWNFLYLFTISVMPFTSHLISEYPENPLSVMIFSGNLILANLSVHAMLTFSHRRGLLTGAGMAALSHYRSLAGIIDLSLYVISIPVALYHPDLGKLCWIGLALSAPLAARISKLRDRRHAAAQLPAATCR